MSLQIALIIEDDSDSDEFKKCILEHIPNAIFRIYSNLNALTDQKTLFHSTDLCFIHIPIFNEFSTEELTFLAEYTSVFAYGENAPKNVLNALLNGYIIGVCGLDLLPATLIQFHRIVKANNKELLDSITSSKFSQQFQSIADNMLSGVVRVLIKKNEEREVLFSNAGFFNLFEVSREEVEKDITIVLRMVHPDDFTLSIYQILQKIKKTGKAVNQYFRIITQDQKIKWIHLISNATETDEGGILHDFIVTDITDQKRKEQFFKEISKVSVNGGWDLDLVSDTLFWTDETKNIHEVPPYFQPDQQNALSFYVDEESHSRVVDCFNSIKETGKPFDDRFEIVTARGNKKWVRLKAKSESVEGKIIRVYGIFQDITEMVKKEQELLESIEEKSALLGEIHHRVKNNLAIISGLLQLELMKRTNSKHSLEDAVNRIQSIATVHEILYSTENFIDIDIEKYINKLVDNISSTYPKLLDAVNIRCEVEQVNLSINQAVPLGLLQNELITNSVKHAFNDIQQGSIDIKIQRINDEKMSMIYKDSGAGFDKQKLESSNSLGFTLIQSLLNQLSADMTINTDQGFHLSCTFNIEDVEHSTIYS